LTGVNRKKQPVAKSLPDLQSPDKVDATTNQMEYK
jgi:hypothetical protein